MALTAAISAVIDKNEYDQILLLKPIMSMDNTNDLGYLPGSMEEKLSPWMASYADNISVIMKSYLQDDDPPPKLIGKKATSYTGKSKDMKALQQQIEKSVGKTSAMEELIAMGKVKFGSLEHFRGRSLSNTYVILDETQNTTINGIRTIVTRLGEGSKIVCLGDITQIDNPYLDSKNNGLSVLVEAFKTIEFAGHITLRKSERSRLAEIASDIL
jgi:PhoH-like ATPase